MAFKGLNAMLISFYSLLVFGLVISILAFNLLGLKWFCNIGFSDAKVPNVNACYEIYFIFLYSIFIYLLQLGCYPVAMVILHVNKT